MTTNLVSILIPCYNAQRWIGQAIESALAQSYPFKEVIVVDDGSRDTSLDIIRSFGDRIRFESGPNRGGNVARNRLLAISRGTWLQYLDADDYLLPDKVERQVSFLAVRQDTDVVYGPAILEHLTETSHDREILPIPGPRDPWILLARWFLPQTGAPLWRRSAIEAVGGWKEDQPCCQEHELYLRLLMAGMRFAYCSASGAIYRQWSEDTVCRRDKREVTQRRMEIEDRAEKFLSDRGLLTKERRQAINEARFEMARIAWLRSRAEATAIIGRIRQSERGFIPRGVAAPPAYRMIYTALGFRCAETIASWQRRVLRA